MVVTVGIRAVPILLHHTSAPTLPSSSKKVFNFLLCFLYYLQYRVSAYMCLGKKKIHVLIFYVLIHMLRKNRDNFSFVSLMFIYISMFRKDREDIKSSKDH